MVFALSLKIFWRELKSGYLNSSLFSLILAVTIVSGISLFTDRLEKALSLESAEFLGGDLKFESNEIPREEILEKAKELGLVSSQQVLFASVVYSDSELQLSSIKTVDSFYPLIGEIELENDLGKFLVTEPPQEGDVWLYLRLKNILDINRMMPSLKNEDESRMSIQADAGIRAAKIAMKEANVSPEDIDGVILGTSHAARYYPAVAIEIQNELGIDGYAYDMLVGCSSTTFAINNAYSDIASGLADTVLVINPEISTPAVNFTKRDIHFIFGDGCVATVVKRDSKSEKSFKIIDRKLITKFSNNIRSDWSYLSRTATDRKTEEELLFYQNGNSVFKEVCPLVAEFISTQLDKNNIKPVSYTHLTLPTKA